MDKPYRITLDTDNFAENVFRVTVTKVENLYGQGCWTYRGLFDSFDKAVKAFKDADKHYNG